MRAFRIVFAAPKKGSARDFEMLDDFLLPQSVKTLSPQRRFQLMKSSNYLLIDRHQLAVLNSGYAYENREKCSWPLREWQGKNWSETSSPH